MKHLIELFLVLAAIWFAWAAWELCCLFLFHDWTAKRYCDVCRRCGAMRFRR